MSDACAVPNNNRRTGHRITWLLALLAGTLAALIVGPWLTRLARHLWHRLVPPDEMTIVQDLGPVLVDVPNDTQATGEPVRISYSFTIKNPAANENLVLALDKRSCGCLSVKQPDPIPPQGTAQVELAFSPSSQSEVRSESVSFKTNLGRPKTITLILKAHTLPRAELTGARRWYIPYGGPYRVESTLRYHSSQSRPPESVELRCGSPDCSLAWTRSWKTEKLAKNVYRHSRPLVLELDERAINTLVTGGVLLPDVFIRLGEQTYRFPLEISSNPPIRISPHTLFLTDATATPIEITADHPFRIHRTNDSLNLLECNVDSDEPRPVHTLQVVLAHPPKDNVAETLLSVELDGLEIPKVTIPVYVFAPAGK